MTKRRPYPPRGENGLDLRPGIGDSHPSRASPSIVRPPAAIWGQLLAGGGSWTAGTDGGSLLAGEGAKAI